MVRLLLVLGIGAVSLPATAADPWAVVNVQFEARAVTSAGLGWVSVGGSGTLVEGAPEGQTYVLTARHNPLGRDPDALRVRASGRPYRVVSVRVSETADLALLTLDAELPAARLAESEPPIGAVVAHRGRRSGLQAGRVTGAYTVGEVAAGYTAPHARGPVYGLNLLADRGDSGAGLFHGGLLVGVMAGGDGRGRAEAVSLAEVRRLIEEARRGD